MHKLGAIDLLQRDQWAAFDQRQKNYVACDSR